MVFGEIYGFFLCNFRLDLQKPRPRPRLNQLDKRLEVTKVEDTGSYSIMLSLKDYENWTTG